MALTQHGGLAVRLGGPNLSEWLPERWECCWVLAASSTWRRRGGRGVIQVVTSELLFKRTELLSAVEVGSCSVYVLSRIEIDFCNRSRVQES